MSEENGTTSLKTKWFEISGKKTAEIISILLLCLFGVLSYAFWTHTTVSDKHGSELLVVLKEIHTGNMAAVREQRVMNCLLTIKQDDRRTALADCERIAR